MAEKLCAVFYHVPVKRGDTRYEEGRVELGSDGEAVISPSLTEFLRTAHVVQEPGTWQMISLADGERYIRALPKLFHGMSMNIRIEEGEDYNGQAATH
jgi:hypothetical protein